MSQWFICFLFYSLGGYALEKLFARCIRSPNRVRKCFLFLPLCPVYGLAMTILIALAPAELGFFPLMLLGCAVCTGVEYLVHLFYDRVLGVRFWDYSLLRGHIHGRICPHFSLIWGVLSALALRLFQPLVMLLIQAAPGWLAYLLWVVLAADCVFSTALLRKYRDINMLTVSAIKSQMRAFSQSSTSL